MTELQILRNSLFDEISRIKRGVSDISDAHAIVKISNAIISSYNTELRAVEILTRTADSSVTELKIFTEDMEKKVIDYVGNKDD